MGRLRNSQELAAVGGSGNSGLLSPKAASGKLEKRQCYEERGARVNIEIGGSGKLMLALDLRCASTVHAPAHWVSRGARESRLTTELLYDESGAADACGLYTDKDGENGLPTEAAQTLYRPRLPKMSEIKMKIKYI